ncbi:hypothetical protein [Actinomycetospora sp. CA-053990]|uniref:hypothetical protein n=1 Tax=Actinomycetospora sp. CA-053990 TaxID=3239891 RepID=UPI003D8F412E
MVFSARRLLLAGLLVVAAVIWVRINKPVEGEVLLELSRRHGVTVADLLSVVMLAMAVVLVWPSRRPRSVPTPAPARRPSPPPAHGGPGPGPVGGPQRPVPPRAAPPTQRF